jgi:CheY-like chemotaxis protein
MNSSSQNEMPLVLIVEDDQATSSILHIWLRLRCRTLLASDGEKALQLVKEHTQAEKKIDLFIFDISLPYPWSGITLKSEIVSHWPVYATVPFIAETAFAMPHDRQAILGAGFAEYLIKPLDRSLLVETVNRYLQGSYL